MYCPQCGKQIPDTSKVCGFCGNKILRVSTPPPPPPAEVPFKASEPEAEPVPEVAPEPVTVEKTEKKIHREEPAEISIEKTVEEINEKSAKQTREKTEKKVKERPAKKPRVKLEKKVKERPTKEPRIKPEKKAKVKAAKQLRVKTVKKPQEKPIPWKWILPAGIGGLVLVFLVLVYFSVLPLTGLQQFMELYLPSPNAKANLNELNCQNNSAEYVEIRSSWMENQVRMDGKPSSNEEWSDATCTNSVFRIPDYGEGLTQNDPISGRWWIKNDAEWVYLLVRLPVKHGQPERVFFDHFWPGPYVDHWAFSDGVSVSVSGGVSDIHGWDEISWKEDTDFGGKNQSKGAFHKDNQYYWFEFKKPLDSGEDLDWSWRPGGSTGLYNSTILGFLGLRENSGPHLLDMTVTFATK